MVTANLLRIWQLQKREVALLLQNHFAAIKSLPVFFLKGEVVAAKCKSTTAQRRSCRLNRAFYLRKAVTAASTHELLQAQRSANDTHEQLSHIYVLCTHFFAPEYNAHSVLSDFVIKISVLFNLVCNLDAVHRDAEFRSKTRPVMQIGNASFDAKCYNEREARYSLGRFVFGVSWCRLPPYGHSIRHSIEPDCKLQLRKGVCQVSVSCKARREWRKDTR